MNVDVLINYPILPGDLIRLRRDYHYSSPGKPRFDPDRRCSGLGLVVSVMMDSTGSSNPGHHVATAFWMVRPETWRHEFLSSNVKIITIAGDLIEKVGESRGP